MGTRIDLTQFWRDYPEYVGRPKEFAIYGATQAIAASAIRQVIPVEIDEGVDFVATALYAVPATAAAANYSGNPFLMQVQFPSGRQLVNMPPLASANAPDRIPYSMFASTSFQLAWDWPYPVILRSGTMTYCTFDNPNALAVVMNVAFHGFQVLL